MTPAARSFMIAFALAVTFASAPAVWAGSAEPAGALASTIQVRGHWLIEVADPDGTIVEVREFHNALLPQGETALVLLLAGNRSAGGMAILLTSTTTASPCAPTASSCLVAEPRAPVTASPAVAKTLSKIVSTDPASITLRGSIQVPGAGSIGAVATTLSSCVGSASLPGPSTISPAACQTGPGISISGVALTQAILANPVALVAGQTVLATVTLSFGTGPAPGAPASR